MNFYMEKRRNSPDKSKYYISQLEITENEEHENVNWKMRNDYFKKQVEVKKRGDLLKKSH